ncbi:MAG: type II toxin-antitoxin system PemK/MazF family toxin [Treponema sp.]|nr:type II toxin-antitoxin system PemK/MazF family toxin [Treponema sp.]
MGIKPLNTNKESKLDEDSVIIAAQFYALDRQKFVKRISKIKQETMQKVENGMKLVLGMNQ